MTDPDQVCWTIEAMMKQELKAYRIPNYLEGLPSTSEFGTPVDSEARLLISQWCLQLATVCEYSRETAAIAMSCLDRFVATKDGRDVLLSRSKFQLAALTSLYTVVKIHEEKALTPEVIATLSRGKHTEEDIEKMEVRMLTALNFRVNPPTAMSFARTFLELVPQEAFDPSLRTVIMEMTECQAEYTLLDYDLCQEKVSTVASASLINAIDIIYGDSSMSSTFNALITRVTKIDQVHLQDLRETLYATIPMDDFADALSKQIRRHSTHGSYNKRLGGGQQIASQSPRGVNEECE